MKLHSAKGFTLVEIMIVVAIIGLLAAIAVPNFMQARNSARANACINNLRLIDAAKQQWALESNSSDTASPGTADIAPYFKGSTIPTCPQGGTAYGDPTAVSVLPVCPNSATFSTHAL